VLVNVNPCVDCDYGCWHHIEAHCALDPLSLHWGLGAACLNVSIHFYCAGAGSMTLQNMGNTVHFYTVPTPKNRVSVNIELL